MSRVHSPELDQLATALSAFQGEVAAIPKTAANPFFKSKYADLATVKAVASPILAKHGLSVSQFISREPNGDALVTWLLHKSGQYIADTMQLRPVKNDPQAQGSATTYGRRYAFMACLGLVADEDDDGEAGSGRGRGSKPAGRKETRTRPTTRTQPAQPASRAEDAPQPVSDDTLREIGKAFKASGASPGELRAILSEVGLPDGKKSDELSEDQGTWVVVKLTHLADAKKAKAEEGSE